MKTLEPMHVVASERGGLYAYRTRRLWCIVQAVN